MVTELIYHADCIEFTKKHLEDILDLVVDWGDEVGEPIEQREISHDEDYGSWPNFYIHMEIGRYDRPHVVIEK